MRKLTKIIIAAIVAVVVLAVVLVAVYLLTRDEAPEAVDLEATVARIEAAEATDEDTAEPSAASPADNGEDVGTTSGADGDASVTGTDDAATAGAGATGGDDAAGVGSADTDTDTASAEQTADAPDGLAGEWTVQVAQNPGDLLGEPTVSFAGFRVDEVLGGGIGDFTAVGRTADVSGTIELTDSALVAATVEVTMSTLRTDNSSRDGQMRRALNTNQFQLATFTLTEPIVLPAGMADGEPFSASAHGDLTIKGVTNRATFDVQAQLVGDTIVAVGASDVVFSDYGVTAPTAPIVVSVEDHGIMEFQLIFTR